MQQESRMELVRAVAGKRGMTPLTRTATLNSKRSPRGRTWRALGLGGSLILKVPEYQTKAFELSFVTGINGYE